jgi:sulfate-transporting ATPase
VDWLEMFLKFPGTVVASPTTGTSWTTRPSGSWNWTAAHGIPWKGNYSSWLDQKQTA